MKALHAAARMSATTQAFDRLAPQYDALADGELFRIMRRRTHDAFRRRLRAGHRVLEIGCGTGLDTSFLAASGMRVVACDPSEVMVSRTLSRLANDGLSGRVKVMPCGFQNLLPFLDAFAEREPFDAIVSNFGALNCIESLQPLRVLGAQALGPSGAILLGLMGRNCAIEAIYFAATGRRALIRRRRSDAAVAVPVAGFDVATYYHRTRAVIDALAPGVKLVRVTGIGVAIPPPYFEARWQTFPPFVRGALAALDAAIAGWPPFNGLGDHVLLQFEKRRSAHA